MFESWLSQGGGIARTQTGLRASVQRSRILDKESEISLLRNGTYLPPQSVRIEMDDSDSTSMGEISGGFTRGAVVFGIHGHPELDDTDIEEWDTFIFDNMEFTVNSVNRHLIGQVQANCTASGS